MIGLKIARLGAYTKDFSWLFSSVVVMCANGRRNGRTGVTRTFSADDFLRGLQHVGWRPGVARTLGNASGLEK